MRWILYIPLLNNTTVPTPRESRLGQASIKTAYYAFWKGSNVIQSQRVILGIRRFHDLFSTELLEKNKRARKTPCSNVELSQRKAELSFTKCLHT